MTCNILYPVRTTYQYRIEQGTISDPDVQAQSHKPMPKRQRREEVPALPSQLEQGSALPINRWVPLGQPGRGAPARTWGSATFDTGRGQILYWGGGHCGYEGNDVDAHDVASNTWLNDSIPEYPERQWNHGVRLAGVTFQGGPWTDHGRRIYAYDPIQQKMIMVRPIRLTTGYEPELLRSFPGKLRVAPDALVFPPSSYVKYATWAYAPDAGRWELLGPAPAGLDTLVSTPNGVMGVTVDWPARLNDAGYQLPWNSVQPSEDSALYLFRGSHWERLDKGPPSPQNLYEMTSLAFDSTRQRVILHGGGERRDELWTCDPKTGRWQNMRPVVLSPEGSAPPACMREAVYLTRQDVFLTLGSAAWAFKVSANSWHKVNIPPPPGAASQNRAMVYDPQRDLVLLVLGAGGDSGVASVYGLRYRFGN